MNWIRQMLLQVKASRRKWRILCLLGFCACVPIILLLLNKLNLIPLGLWSNVLLWILSFDLLACIFVFLSAYLGKLTTRLRLILIFTVTLFLQYGFYTLIYSKLPCLRDLWHQVFEWIFPGLDKSTLNVIPYIELGVSFYAVGVLLLGLHKSAPFPEWNPYDLKKLQYSIKISPCATAYLACLFFSAYTGTYRWAFVNTFALFFTQLSAVCFEHDLSKKAVQRKVARFAKNSIQEQESKSINNGAITDTSLSRQFYKYVCEEFASICNHALSYKADQEKVPVRYADIAKDISALADIFVDELMDFSGANKKKLQFSIGYAMLGYATLENSDARRVGTFYGALLDDLRNPYISWGLLLRISNFEKKGLPEAKITSYYKTRDADFLNSIFKDKTNTLFWNSSAKPFERIDTARSMREGAADEETGYEDLKDVFTYHLSSTFSIFSK